MRVKYLSIEVETDWLCGTIRLLDDDFMTKVFEDEDCVGFLLKIILNRDDLTVKRSNSQYTVKNLQGRSVRLDILAVDRENRVCLTCKGQTRWT